MMPAMDRPPLWTCPRCGQSFVTRNMSHSCCQLTEDAFFAGRAPQRALYRAFRAFVERCGPVTVNINKTRISFQGRARFATVARVTKDGLVCTFWVKRRLDSPRFTKIDAYPRSDHVHSFKLTDAAQLDAEAAAWIAEAYEVGMQRWPPPGPAGK
jgi:hypothetical protein